MSRSRCNQRSGLPRQRVRRHFLVDCRSAWFRPLEGLDAGSVFRLRWCLLLVLVWLTGCTDVSGAVFGTMKAATVGRITTFSTTAAEVEAKPFFQLEVKTRFGTGLMILGNVDHGRESWYDASGKILFLEHGLVVKTLGFPEDVLDTRWPDDSPFVTGLQHLREPLTASRQVDLDGYRFGVEETSRWVPEGEAEIDILGTRHHLLRVVEQVSTSDGRRALNHYWVDPADGFVWKSEQTLPGGLVLTLTSLKPYKGGVHAATP